MKISLLIMLILSAFILESGVLKHKQDNSKNKTLKEKFAFIPSGNVFINENSYSVQSYYISKTEITNKQYAEFLSDLLKNEDLINYQIAQVDSSKWNMNNSINSKFVDFYHIHPAYEEYPVVNISYEAAKLFCVWLSEKYNSKFGTKEFNFRLPKKEEYIRAARGDSKQVNYAWGSNFLRNKDGQILCNFLQIGSENIHQNSESGKYEIVPIHEFTNFNDVIAPAKSYWPNQFGVYNLNGNVAEMIDQPGVSIGGSWRNTGYDVRIESQSTYEQANPMTGFRVVMTYFESK